MMTLEREEELRRLHAKCKETRAAWMQIPVPDSEYGQLACLFAEARADYKEAIDRFNNAAYQHVPELLEEIQRLRALLVACRVGD